MIFMPSKEEIVMTMVWAALLIEAVAAFGVAGTAAWFVSKRFGRKSERDAGELAR